MADSIKSVFAEVASNLVVNSRKVKEIHDFAVRFVNKNSEHIAFFGGNLLGVQTIRFTSVEKDKWFEDILDVDDLHLKKEFHSLPAINVKFNVSSDVFNLSCVAMLNKIYQSDAISAGEKERALMDVTLIMQYKLLTSIMYHFFPYPADRAVATATYAALTKKYALKVHGSWQALLEARSRDILAHNSIHYRTYTELDNDEAVVYMVNDIQGRLREIIKNMRSVFEVMRNSKNRIVTTNSVAVTLDGESFVRDKTRNFTAYKRYLHEVISDQSSFVRQELVTIIGNAMHTMPERFLVESLQYMTNKYGTRTGAVVSDLADETLLHAFEFISGDRATLANPNDLAGLIARLRAIYMASRSSDPSLLKMRDLAERIVASAIPSRNPSIIASVRTGVMLYLVLRAFTMKYYSQ